jgi:hypothetical protein
LEAETVHTVLAWVTMYLRMAHMIMPLTYLVSIKNFGILWNSL